MKKIITLIGSRAEKSNTARLAEFFVGKLREVNTSEGIENELLFPEQWGLKPCISCNNCFTRGVCVLDENDGMKQLKEKLMASDVVIIGSPVFAAHVSGDTKHLIDRLSMWLHTMPLIGKYGIVLSTTSSNNGDAVTDYLGRMMEGMGLQIVLRLNAFIHKGEPMITDLQGLTALISEPASILSDALFRGIRPQVSETLAAYYAHQSLQYKKIKKLAANYPLFDSGERRLWEEQGYMPYATIQELLRMTL